MSLPRALLVTILLTACGNPKLDATPTPRWQPAFDAQATGWLLSVWGSNQADVYAVGGSEAKGVLVHFDGSGWQPVALEFDVPLLTWVHGFDADSVTVVGNEGSVLQYDGERWQLQSTPTEQNLWGVWGAAPDDLWAVGGSGLSEEAPALLHFDGTNWQAHQIVDFERPGVHALFKVWGTSRDNVYAVGQNGAVLHFDGEQWREQLVGASADLISLWGTGPDNIVVVGGRGNGVVSTFNGQTWATQSLISLPGLNGVWFRNPSVVHVVGERGTLLRLDPADWSHQDDSVVTELDLHGVFGIAGDKLLTVGGNFMRPVPPYEGIALTRRMEQTD
jgi:hypothetical protein